ncbi:hypothetical protein F4780DRAFT_274438 [Xylariomycetidae sp. FL0641]|nr:hypothetical protein F4780DRAFT_274438 [Xylariomycetidae sp. FL0641]
MSSVPIHMLLAGRRATSDPDGSDKPNWSSDQFTTIVILERLGAALSVAGVLLIFIAYAAFKRLRSVPNTFIVFASFANLGASIACLIGYSGVHAGPTSNMCQVQAFMFELFMQSDPWWSFAMAVNVYMVFFFSANPRNFLRYWWAYFLVCYGIPFIPALWLLVVRDSQGNVVYGDATIWCWIDRDSSDLRIYTYYLPIWVCIVLSTCIYIAVGYYVFKQRNQLRNLSLSNPSPDPPRARDSGEKNLFTNAAVMGTVNREVIQVTTLNTTVAHRSDTPPSVAPANWFDDPITDTANLDGAPGPVASPNPYHTVTRITASPAPKEGWWKRTWGSFGRVNLKLNNMDPVKMAYLRTSFVFAVSVFVTWTPSSINRVHDLVYTEHASFGLNLASAIVLPLQGVWNAVIFFSTSFHALRDEFRALRDGRRGVPRGQNTADAVRNERERERERAVELERRHCCPCGGRGTKTARDDAESEISASSTVGGHAGCCSPSTMRVMRGDSLSSL